MDSNAFKKMTQARIALLLNEPFFGSLAYRLRLVENNTIETLRTNGVTIEYNAEYVNGLTHDLCMSANCHEVLHVSNGHAWRRDARDAKRWNVACDYAINPILQESGFKLDDTWLHDVQFAGMSAEQIYNALPDSNEPDEPNGPGNEPGNGPGEVSDAPTDDVKELEQDWQVATMQAAQAAKAQGKLPGSLKGMVDALREQRTDWRAYTLRFAQEKCSADYTMRTPNLRYVQAGLYLPALRDEQMGEMIVAVDTSGSCYSAVPMFGAHLQNVIDTVKPRLLHVVYCDDEVQTVDTFEPGDAVTLRQDGGGGTSFCPPFDWIAAQGIEPACMIYLTDCEGAFPDPAPFPVLWACTEKHITAPFGETIYIGD